jgi:hypothetical protein
MHRLLNGPGVRLAPNTSRFTPHTNYLTSFSLGGANAVTKICLLHSQQVSRAQSLP